MTWFSSILRRFAMSRRSGVKGSKSYDQLEGGRTLLPSTGRAQDGRLNALLLACFLATFTFYFERTGFPIVFTHAAKGIGKGLNEATKGQVMSSFFWGYATSQIPASWVAHKRGGYYTLAGSFACWSTLCLLEPSVLTVTPLLLILRALIGVAQGFVIPSIHSLLAAAIGKGDKSKAVSFVTSGMYLGSSTCYTVMPSVVSAYGTGFSLVSLGGLGLAWFSLWILFKSWFCDSPSSADKAASGDVEMARREGDSASSAPATGGSRQKIPWELMLRSTAVWAIIVNNFVFHYAVYVIMSWLPTYVENVIKVQLTGLGYAKALPYLMMFAASNFGGIAGGYLTGTLRISVKWARTIINTFGLGMSAVTIFCMYQAETKAQGLLVVTSSLSFLGFARGGFAVNHMDIAPEYAGVIMGISNTAGTVAGIFGVAFTGYLLEVSGGASAILGWKLALGFASLLNIFGLTIFHFFSKGTKVFSS